jgi:hypothetical protein
MDDDRELALVRVMLQSSKRYTDEAAELSVELDRLRAENDRLRAIEAAARSIRACATSSVTSTPASRSRCSPHYRPRSRRRGSDGTRATERLGAR